MKKNILYLLSFVLFTNLWAQNAAISSHTNFNVDGSGDIILSEVRVPKSGLATYTYYEVLGWQGTGAGYAGIQDHPNGHNFIFSIWDNTVHTDVIKAVYTGFGTETEGFGGEGTGLKSWNFEYTWKEDYWYTLAARSWAVGNHTYYGYWVKDGVTGEWRHLVTMDVAATNSYFTGQNDAFIEDWIGSGQNYRETNIRNIWKRLSTGAWKGATSGYYSINSWDAVSGGRSYNYRNNWDGGVKTDATGSYYYMACGGTVTATTTSPKTFTNTLNTNTPNYTKGEISTYDVVRYSTNEVKVSWNPNTLKLPQFSCKIQFYDNASFQGTPLAEKTVAPHEREAILTVGQKMVYGKMTFTDLFDQTSEKTFSFDNSANTDCQGVKNGTATLDNCNVCVGGTTGKTACTQDCNNVWGGTAFIDDCDSCVGGTTGKTACYILKDGWYKIKSDYTKKCIYMNNGLKQYTCSETDTQVWYIQEESTGVYSIKNKATGTYLTAASTSNGAALSLSSTLTNASKFTVKIISEGVVQFYLYNNSARSLDLSGWSGDNDASIIVYSNTGNQNQYFDLEKVEIITNVETMNTNSLVIYPNPSTGKFYLNQEIEWFVYNSLGMNVLNGNQQEIDLSNFPSGIYIVKTENSIIRIEKK